MVWINWQSLVRYGAIASVGFWAIACQPTAESPLGADEPDTPTATEPAAAPPAPTDAGADASSTPAAPAESTSESAGNPVAATPQQTCSAAAYVVDTDPAGLNVRSGPGSDFAVQDTLPTREPVEVLIVGATGEWFLVNEAWSGEQQELEQPGWVYGPLLGVSTTSLDINDPNAPTTLYAEPDGDAAVTATIPKGAEARLLGCSGNWLQVEAPEATGWLAVGEQCNSAVPVCP